jgi:16S rRNA (guanine(1405)-N(7))-methyltransferase
MIERLPELIETVRQGSKYRHIHEDLIRNIAMSELNKDRSWKETIKAVRNKIHQVGSAYQPTGIDYERLIEVMKSLPRDIQNPLVKDFCRDTMKQHASTRERLVILDQFYLTIFTNHAPITSLLDVACGLNPLALAWIPLSPECDVMVCDIYGDQIDFLNLFFDYFQINGKAICCDLTQEVPEGDFQIALVLKTIPCLEQIDKKIGSRLLNGINSKNILVSFPAKSLGGRDKGMRQFYSAHFEAIIAEHNWQVDKFSFSNEEAFLVHK